MQTKELIRATIRVVNTMDKSGRATTVLPSLRFLVAAGIFVALALAPALTDAQGVPSEIAGLKAQVAALQSQVNQLQTQLTAVQSNNALKLGPFVGVVSGLVDGVNGPHIFFTGANIHIVSGSTTTADSVTGLGNLIIGYNEVPIGFSPGDRGGSHNLVIGRYNRFTQAASGGLVGGERNKISNLEASVSGGANNTADGRWASVSGGVNNIASGTFASVSGGNDNKASSYWASVTGGNGNIADGQGASVSGGNHNIASSYWASVTGGNGNIADGGTVVGGDFNTASGGTVVGGRLNISSGEDATVLGGFQNVAGGFVTVVIGGEQVTNDDKSIAPQPPFP